MESPLKTGYNRDSDYELESENLSPKDIKEEKLNPKKKQKIGRCHMRVVTSIVFTLGQTRMMHEIR